MPRPKTGAFSKTETNKKKPGFSFPKVARVERFLDDLNLMQLNAQAKANRYGADYEPYPLDVRG